MSVLVMTNAEIRDTPSRRFDGTGRSCSETFAVDPTLLSMTSIRVGAWALVALLLLCGCTADPTPVGTASAPAALASGWQSIPELPLDARSAPVAAWTGQEILVIGGVPGPPCPPNADCVMPEFARDGAAYDPATRTWRQLPDAPVGVGESTAAFTGGTLFVTAADDSGHMRLLAYDTSTSTWTSHAAPDDAYRTPVALGDRVLLVAGSDEGGEVDDLVFDIESVEWSSLPPDPLSPAFDRIISSTSDGLFLTATALTRSPGSETPARVSVARFDEPSQQWTQLPDTDQISSGVPWMLVEDELVTVLIGGIEGADRRYPDGGILSLPNGAWSTLEAPKKPAADAWIQQTAVSDRFAITSGYVYDHCERTWTALGGPSDAPVYPGTAVWADDVLYVIGGSEQVGPDAATNRAWRYVVPESDGF